jgi:uncharacterized protein YndB with AHSA1/START domain
MDTSIQERKMENEMNAKSNYANNNNKNNNNPGTVTIEGGYATLQYKRRLPHSPELIWKAITDPKEVTVWFNTTAKIDARPGGTLEYIAVPVGFRRTGRILAWDPPRVFEHEWHIDPHPQFPKGDTESVIRWELVRDSNDTIVTMTHRRLAKDTSLRFAVGWHAFLDRLAVRLNGENLPDQKERSAAVAGLYTAQYAAQ